MAINRFMESSLASSEVFQGINSIGSPGQSVQEKAVNLIKTAKHLTNEDIETAYISVKQISDSLTRAAMLAFDEERTVLVYNSNPSLSITQALPFITFKTKTGYVTYVFVDKYISVSRDGVMNMQAPVLRDLLTGAVIANGLKRNYTDMASNQYLQKVMMEIYTKFFSRIIIRSYSVGSEKQVFDTIQYWVNRFFLEHIFNAADTPENLDRLSATHIKFLDEMQTADIKEQYNAAAPAKLSELLELLKGVSPRLKSLNLGNFLNEWINYYYVPSMLAVDNIEYLIFMVVTLLAGNNIINISASDIVKETKNIKSLRGELQKLTQ